MLNQRAADWFEAQGDAESTLDYSHAAGNEDSAARILSSIAMPVSAAGACRAVESWLDRFDDETLQRYPAVAVEGSRIHACAAAPSRPRPGWRPPSAAPPKNGKGAATRACIDVLRAAMCADGPERMLKTADVRARRAPARPSVAPVGAGRERHRAPAARRRRSRRPASSRPRRPRPTQPESHALALSERSLLAAGRDDDGAEALALEAQRLIEEGELDGYPTSALDLAATARALLRHGRWDEARRQLTITQRLAPSLTHAIPWLSVQVRLELGHAYVTLRDRNGARALLGEAREILALRPSLGVLAEQVAALEARDRGDAGGARRRAARG